VKLARARGGPPYFDLVKNPFWLFARMISSRPRRHDGASRSLEKGDRYGSDVPFGGGFGARDAESVDGPIYPVVSGRVASCGNIRWNHRRSENPQTGLFLFTAKHYAIIRDTADQRRPPVKDPANPTPAEALATYGPFVAQAGSYEVTGDDTLVLRPSVMMNPPADGNYTLAFTYTFKIDGNNLTVTQVSSSRRRNVPNPITTRLTRVE